MRIPRTSIRTTWRANWLVEFSIALVALALLTREITLAAVGAGILFAWAFLAVAFHRELDILRCELHVARRLSKTRMFLGDSIDGELTIRNTSQSAASILTVQPVVDKALSFGSSLSFSRLVPPGTTSASNFAITPAASGRFQMSGFQLTLTDARGLFTGTVTYAQASWVEVLPGMRMRAPLTPLRLYGGSLDIFRKAQTGTDYAGIREYASGDEYHRVEWKATARLRTLMVKEFHPEAQTVLQILIDARKTMHRQSHVGTRLDEALAVAGLLTESAAASRIDVGIWVYDEKELLKVMKPATAIEQVPRLRELSLALQAKNESGEQSASLFSPRTFSAESFMSSGERVAAFVRLLKIRLGMAHREDGAYKALTEAARIGGQGIVVVLTDLETNTGALLEAASIRQKRGTGIVIAQIGAAWRLSDDLELAYAGYQRNRQKLHRLQRMGLVVFDVGPERVIEAVSMEVMGIIPTVDRASRR